MFEESFVCLYSGKVLHCSNIEMLGFFSFHKVPSCSRVPDFYK